MRVLMLARALPLPGDTGLSLRTLQVLRYLAREHEVTLVAFERDVRDQAHAFALEPLCQKVVLVPHAPSLSRNAAALATSVLLGDSYYVRRERKAAMRAAVARLLATERVDVIHADHLSMTQFIPLTWTRPVVLDSRFATWQDTEREAQHQDYPLRRWLLRREARLQRLHDASACRRATVTLASSERERLALEGAIGTTWAVHVVPPSVDLAYLEPLWQQREPDGARLLTVGPYFQRHDTTSIPAFLRSGYPLVRAKRPDAHYDLIGSRLRRGAETLLRDQPHISLYPATTESTASDADDVQIRDAWRLASVFVAPWHSGQAHLEILQAMAAGVPVVAAPASVEGLSAVHGEHLLVAGDPGQMASHILRLIHEPLLARQLIMRARRLVQDRYDTPIALAGLQSAYAHVLEGAPRCVLCS